MTIEIKVTGVDAKEATTQLAELAGYLRGAVESTIIAEAIAPLATQLPTDPPPVKPQSEPVEDDDADSAGDTDRTGLDADGVPYDTRIHADAKNPKKADGTWKRRKNLSDDEYNKVFAELKASVAPAPVAPAPQAAPVAPAPQAAPADLDPAKQLQSSMSKCMSALNAHTPGSAAKLIMQILPRFGAATLPALAAEHKAAVAAIMDRMTADPDNAEAIANGLM